MLNGSPLNFNPTSLTTRSEAYQTASPSIFSVQSQFILNSNYKSTNDLSTPKKTRPENFPLFNTSFQSPQSSPIQEQTSQPAYKKPTNLSSAVTDWLLNSANQLNYNQIMELTTCQTTKQPQLAKRPPTPLVSENKSLLDQSKPSIQYRSLASEFLKESLLARHTAHVNQVTKRNIVLQSGCFIKNPRDFVVTIKQKNSEKSLQDQFEQEEQIPNRKGSFTKQTKALASQLSKMQSTQITTPKQQLSRIPIKSTSEILNIGDKDTTQNYEGEQIGGESMSSILSKAPAARPSPHRRLSKQHSIESLIYSNPEIQASPKSKPSIFARASSIALLSLPTVRKIEDDSTTTTSRTRVQIRHDRFNSDYTASALALPESQITPSKSILKHRRFSSEIHAVEQIAASNCATNTKKISLLSQLPISQEDLSWHSPTQRKSVNFKETMRVFNMSHGTESLGKIKFRPQLTPSIH